MVLAGLERLDSGEIVIADTQLHKLGEDALADFRGRNIGIVFQSFHLIANMTALENVAVPLELANTPIPSRSPSANSSPSVSVNVSTTIPVSFPAESSSVSPSPARLPPHRPC